MHTDWATKLRILWYRLWWKNHFSDKCNFCSRADGDLKRKLWLGRPLWDEWAICLECKYIEYKQMQPPGMDWRMRLAIRYYMWKWGHKIFFAGNCPKCPIDTMGTGGGDLIWLGNPRKATRAICSDCGHIIEYSRR